MARPLVVIDPDIWRPGSQPQLILLTELVGLACVDHETAGLTRCQQDDHRSAGCEIWMALKRRYGAHEWAWGTTGAPPARAGFCLDLVARREDSLVEPRSESPYDYWLAGRGILDRPMLHPALAR